MCTNITEEYSLKLSPEVKISVTGKSGSLIFNDVGSLKTDRNLFCNLSARGFGSVMTSSDSLISILILDFTCERDLT